MRELNREDLTAYLDGALDESEAAKVEDRLAREPGLRAELASLREVVELLRAQGPAQAPDGFADRLEQRLRDEPLPARRWWRPWGLPIEGLALAAAALLVVVAGLQLTGGGTGTMAPTVASAPEQLEEGAAGSPYADAVADAEDDWEDEALYEAEPELLDELEPPAEPDEVMAQAPTRSAAPRPAPRPRERPSAAPPPPPPAAETAPVGRAAPSPEADDAGPTMRAVPWRYVVLTAHPDALQRLQAIAQRHGGRLEDAGGNPVGQLPADPSGIWHLRVPHGALSGLQAELRAVGQVQAVADDRFASDPLVSVRIDLHLEQGAYEASDTP